MGVPREGQAKGWSSLGGDRRPPLTMSAEHRAAVTRGDGGALSPAAFRGGHLEEGREGVLPVILK